MSPDSFCRPLVEHPRLVLTGFLLLTLAIGWQATRFEVDASADTLLTRDNEHYINTQLVNRRFSPDEFVLLAYRPTAHELFSAATYDDVRTISDRLVEIPRAKSVQSILNVPLLAARNGPLTAIQDLEGMTLEQGDYSDGELQEIFSGHPLFEDLLINADQTATAIQLSFAADPHLTELNNRIIDLQSQLLEGNPEPGLERELADLRAEAEPLQKALDRKRIEEIGEIREIISGYEDRAEVYLGGAHVLGFQLIQIIQRDLVVFGSAIGLMICLVLFIVFRHLRWVVIPVVCCACSVLTTMGLLAMLGLKATVISANFIALQLILTLAIVIHLIVQYREYARENTGAGVRELVSDTVKAKAAPCLYAGLTTSVGFCSLLLSDIQPVIAFGYMMILAMAVTILTSLILFPAMMALFDREQNLHRARFTELLVNSLCHLALKRPLLTGCASVLSLGLLAAGIAWLNVENSFLNYFDEDTDAYRELSFIDREFGGSTPLDVVYHYRTEPVSEDLVLTAEAVQQMQQVQQNLRDRNGTGKVLSVVNFTEVARDMNGDRPLTEYELNSLYLLMEDSLREELLGSFIVTDTREVRISARIQDSTPGLNRREFITDLRNDLNGILPPEAGLRLTNLFVLYQDVLEKLYRSQILTLGLVFMVLALAFALIFRSLRISFLTIFPNVLSTLAVLGVMGWLGIPLDLMTTTIAAIAMGIAVDDTIHYVHRFQTESRQASTSRAIENSHRSVGYAIVYTSLIIMLGFSLLSFSDFVPSVYFGLLTGLAMALAMLGNLTLLPVLLQKFAPGHS